MKVVYDTCVYIDLLRTREPASIFFDRSHIRYLSPIVMMELLTGAHTPLQNRTLDRLIEPYQKAKRIIPITADLYYKAGQNLSKLGATHQTLHTGLSHDILIALSTLSVGATLFTSNKKDFTLISRIVPLKLEYI